MPLAKSILVAPRVLAAPAHRVLPPVLLCRLGQQTQLPLYHLLPPLDPWRRTSQSNLSALEDPAGPLRPLVPSNLSRQYHLLPLVIPLHQRRQLRQLVLSDLLAPQAQLFPCYHLALSVPLHRWPPSALLTLGVPVNPEIQWAPAAQLVRAIQWRQVSPQILRSCDY